MIWRRSWRADPAAARLADRHYNRKKIGARQFVPPGRCLVLRAVDGDAVWVTSWPFADYVKHAWGGAWINSLFRRESGPPASDMIRDAVAATRWMWPEIPALGMITFVDADRVERKRTPGRCYELAGFRRPPCVRCGGVRPWCVVCAAHRGRAATSDDGLVVWQMLAHEMPAAAAPHGAQALLVGTA